jgi:hypothetical protein
MAPGPFCLGMSTPNLTLFCAVSRFNTQTARDLIAENRLLELDWTRASPDETNGILKLLSDMDRSAGPMPRGKDEVIVKIGHFSEPAFPLHRFRHLFADADYEKVMSDLLQNGPPGHRIRHVGTPHDYVEDEHGRAISLRERLACVYGAGCMPWDRQSILDLGPTPVSKGVSCTEKDASTLVQFVSIVDQIVRSDWLRKPASLTYRRAQAEGELIEVVFPSDENTRSVATLFRQLYSTHSLDGLMAGGCKVYGTLASNPLKRQWVLQQKESFGAVLASPPFQGTSSVGSVTQLLDLFLYGCRVMHARSSKNAEPEMAALMKEKGEEVVALEVTSAFRRLAHLALEAQAIVAQDLPLWLTSGQIPQSQRPTLPNFLRSWTKSH